MARWELSRRLANRRKHLGMDVSTVTKALGFSRNYWSAVENDRTLIAVEKLRLLFELMEIDESDQTELLDLRSAARKRGWWDDYSSVLDEDTKRFIGLEAGATRIRIFESNIIPGLLQIGEYTQAILEADPAFSPISLDDLRSVREHRQRRLQKGEALQFTALLSQAALHQQVGGPEVQRRQLEHILTLVAERPDNIQVRVVPFETNPGAIVSSSTLQFLDFESPHLPSIAWQEAVRNLDIVIESEDDEYRRLDRSWDDGLTSCLDRDNSVTIIEQLSEKVAP